MPNRANSLILFRARFRAMAAPICALFIFLWILFMVCHPAC